MAVVRLPHDRWRTNDFRRDARRIEEVVARRLIEKFSGEVTVSPDGAEVVVTLSGDELALSREAATALRDELAAALTRREEFFRTAGEHREDGSYVVSRRAATSAGHSKVFRSFRELERLYDRLPDEFTAEDVGRTGLTGGRRHMLVRHFVEHPAFDCELVSRQPLTTRKLGASGRREEAAETEEAAPAD